MSIAVNYGQTILDVTVQGTGDISQMLVVAALNELSLTDELVPGATLEVPTYDPSLKKTVNYFSVPANFPASGISAIQQVSDGIGFWYIGLDFQVS
jgi:hypothetical protein